MSENIELLYPIYLDIPMMISFVAAIDGGYALEKVWKETHDSSGEMSGSLEGEAGLSNIISHLVKASLKASGNIDGKLASSSESQIVFKHTEASLFMRLRHELRRKGEIIPLDNCDRDNWSKISPSSLVEMSGEIRQTPINGIVQFSRRFIPIMIQSLPIAETGNVDLSKLSSGERDLLKNISMMQAIIADLDASPLSDILLKHTEGWEKTGVLDLSTKILPLEQQELLNCGRVRVIGKATRILTDKETINLYRRSVLGVAAQNVSSQIAQTFSSSPEMEFKLESPLVKYPAVEIIPMAIYV